MAERPWGFKSLLPHQPFRSNFSIVLDSRVGRGDNTVIEKGIAWRVPTAGLARLTQEGARMVQLRKRAAQ